LREWLRTLTIYSGSIFFSTLALAPLVWLIRHVTHYQSQAPYIAGAAIAVCNVVISFFGHRRFSFATKAATSKSPEPQESQSSKH
jgi:putative flippase GtrA